MSIASYFASLSVPNLFSRMPAGIRENRLGTLSDAKYEPMLMQSPHSRREP